MNINDRRAVAELLTNEAIRAREFGYEAQRIVFERVIVLSASLLGVSVLAVRIDGPDNVWAIFVAWGVLTGSISAAVAGFIFRWLFHSSQYDRALKMGVAVENAITADQLIKMKETHERALQPYRWAVRVSLPMSLALLLAGLGLLLTFAATNIPS